MKHRPITLFPLFVAVVTLLMIPGQLQAQRASELGQGASRVGLTRVWSRSIATGHGGKVSGVTVYVSPTKSYRGSEVVDKFGRRVFFSDRNANRATSRAGYDQTSRLTELKEAELAARGLDPQVELKQISDVTLYVRTSLGTVTALDAETGKRQWSTQAGTAGYPSYGVSASDQYVVTLSGTTLYLLDAETGQVLDSVPTRGIPSATATIHGDLIYAPTTKGFIDVLATEDLARREFTLGSSGRLDNSVTVSPSTVSWTADDGHLYVAAVGTQGLKYRFESLDALVASPAYMDETLFVTSLDGFVVAIEEKNGEIKWRHSTGSPIREAPLAVDGNVYVTTIDGQMTALDAATGKVTWLATNVQRSVSVSDSRIYCISAGPRLTVLDKTTGGYMGSTPISEMDLPIVNTNTDRVYLVSNSGVLHCLREPGNRWPIARKPAIIETPEVETETTEAPSDPFSPPLPSAQEEQPAETGDSFGGFGAEDDAAEDSEADVVDDSDPFAFGDDDAATNDDGGGGNDDAEADDSDPFG